MGYCITSDSQITVFSPADKWSKPNIKKRKIGFCQAKANLFFVRSKQNCFLSGQSKTLLWKATMQRATHPGSWGLGHRLSEAKQPDGLPPPVCKGKIQLKLEIGNAVTCEGV